MFTAKIVIALVLIVALYFIGLFLSAQQDPARTYKSSVPAWIFNIIWPVLYALLFFSLSMTIEQSSTVFYLFILFFVLSLLWMAVFYLAQNRDLAQFILILLIFNVVFLMKESFAINHTAGWLLAPLLVWLAFAIFLTRASAMIQQTNQLTQNIDNRVTAFVNTIKGDAPVDNGISMFSQKTEEPVIVGRSSRRASRSMVEGTPLVVDTPAVDRYLSNRSSQSHYNVDNSTSETI